MIRPSLWLAAILSGISSLPAQPPMGGLPPRVAKGGAMDGLIDMSPLAKAEIALRQLPQVANVAIEPGGWRIVTKTGVASHFVPTACSTLRANGIPRGVRVVIVPSGGRPATFLCRPPSG